MLDPIVSTLEGLPEAVAAEYVAEEDGTFKLQVSMKNGWGLENVAGLKTTMADWKAKAEKYTNELNNYKDSEGNMYDVSELLKAKEQLVTLEGATPKDKVEALVTQRVADHKTKYETEVAKLVADKEKLQTDLYTVVVEQAAVTAIAKAGASDAQEMLLPAVMKRLRSDVVDGKPRPVVIGENGTPRISLKSGSQEMMEVDELLEEMRGQPAFSVAFPGSGNSGSGTPPAAGSQHRQSASGAVVLSEADALIPVKWRAAQEKAEKAGVEVEIQADA